jgi:hypothetical protein
MSREQFAQALSEVKEGMTEAEVLAIAGKPDDVRTQHDPGGLQTYRTKEIWCYGTNGHRTFPTRGSVYIDEEGKVQWVFGGGGTPLGPEVLAEEELLPLLRLIDRLPSYNSGHAYDPSLVIRVVNALHPLGKDKALAVVQEYARVANWERDAYEGLFLVLRVLFDVPANPGHLPVMYVGAAWRRPPKDLTCIPRFPILLVDYIPLLLVEGYMLSGEAEGVESHVEQLRDRGQWRAGPLTPTNDPLRSFTGYEQVYRSAYGQGPEEGHQVMIINQLLRLVDGVYRLEPDRDGYRFRPGEEVAGRWRRLVSEARKRAIVWNAEKQRYTYADGSHLPDVQPKTYRREIWKLEGLEGEAKVVLERRDRERVRVEYNWSGQVGAKLGPAEVEVLAPRGERVGARLGKTLTRFRPSSLGAVAGDMAFSVQSHEVELVEGEEIQVKLTIGDSVKLSPVFKP